MRAPYTRYRIDPVLRAMLELDLRNPQHRAILTELELVNWKSRFADVEKRKLRRDFISGMRKVKVEKHKRRRGMANSSMTSNRLGNCLSNCPRTLES